jgi:hypothetical protein
MRARTGHVHDVVPTEVAMLTIKINGEARKWPAEADEKWVTQRINGLHRDGVPVCVQVTVDAVNLTFQTRLCSAGGGSGGSLSRDQLQVLELWRRLHLDDMEVSPGNVVAFLKQVA